MSDTPMDRRDALKTMGGSAMALGAAYGVPAEAWARFRAAMRTAQYEYVFFTGPMLDAVQILADMIIPRDDHSGSATEAGVIEYMDFVLHEARPAVQTQWKAGFAWLDARCQDRWGRSFTACSPGERARVLNDIAFPRGAGPDDREAVRWFNGVRDLVGAGFFSSRMGVEDIGYRGGGVQTAWTGAPPEVLRELGVSYDAWDRRYGGGT